MTKSEAQTVGKMRVKTDADGTFTHMNTGLLDSLEFPYSPIELQVQFTVMIEKIENLTKYHQSRSDLGALYDTLSQQVFKGELDLSRVKIAAGEAAV